MRVERLGIGASPGRVLRRLRELATHHSHSLPAALLGDWFESRAIIAPQLDIQADVLLPDYGSSLRQQHDAHTSVGGGWIGAYAFPDRATADGLPSQLGGFTDQILRLDNDGAWWFESLIDSPCPAHLKECVLADAPSISAHPFHCSWSVPDRVSHTRAVQCCLSAIREGEIYQACVTTQYTGQIVGDPLDFFLSVVENTRPAKAAFLTGPWGTIASFSPELYLRRRGKVVTESPIKGTLPHHLDPHLLQSSAKDTAENIMIVDLVRHDLGQLADTGSVRVTDLLRVRKAPGVWHLVSSVSAHLNPVITDEQLLQATFPPASVTGTPKKRARELLSLWEPQGRGIYCGTIGMSSPRAGLDLNVAIRTVTIQPHGAMRLGVGGGITADSDPENEWQECCDKAASIISS